MGGLNLYFVGTHSASVHLVDTGEGLIMIDSGYPANAMYVISGIYRLGFSPEDIKLILHTHGHFDHFGSTRALLKLCDAKTILGAEDAPYATGEIDLSLSELFGVSFRETFRPDILLYDGMDIRLGNTVIHCVSTPGHTFGTFSFFFDVTDGERTLRAGMHGGVGLNTLSRKFLTEHNFPFSLREQYLSSLDKIMEEKVEIFLGNHVGNNRTAEKIDAVLKGNPNAFYAPEEWKPFLIGCKESLNKLIEKES